MFIEEIEDNDYTFDDEHPDFGDVYQEPDVYPEPDADEDQCDSSTFECRKDSRRCRNHLRSPRNADEDGELSVCDHCAEPSADLEYFESADESVGLRDGQYLCPKCRPRRKP